MKRTTLLDFSEDKTMYWSHFTAEGDVELKVVLFVPTKAPHYLYGSYYNAKNSNLKLYVRCVFISDGFDDLLPWYLNFLMGDILGSWLKLDSSATNQTKPNLLLISCTKND